MKVETGNGLMFSRNNNGSVTVLILGAILSSLIPVKDGEKTPKLDNAEVEITSDVWASVVANMGTHPGLEMSENDRRDLLGDEYDAEDNEGATVNRESSTARNSGRTTSRRKSASGSRARR